MKSNLVLSLSIAIFIFLSACSNNQSVDAIVTKKDSVVTASDSLNKPLKSYSADCKNLVVEAKRMDSLLLKEMEVKVDVANQAIKAFTDFAYYCSNDSLCPIYLIKTAQVAQSINNIPQAKIVLDKCVDEYPNSIHRPAAMFLLAQLYDEATYLNNEAEAKRIYEKIISEYPKSDWAKSSKGALNFVGKSDEQIMQSLKKQK
jgi:tetratricopeptide (TPR) repeat protein